MGSLLYVCNECDAMHEDEADHCETCGSGSMRAIPESELLEGMKYSQESEKNILKLQLTKTEIQLIEQNGEIYLDKGLLIEGDGLCAIYSDGSFDFVCTADYELHHILATQNLTIKEVKEERLCSECRKPMQEGFYFESDCRQYCSEESLTKVMSWAEYMKIYDDGNGDAYWTSWEEI